MGYTMSHSAAFVQRLILIAVIAALLIVTLLFSINLLPAPPLAPTPTWPRGIDLPDILPRIPPG